MYTYIVVNNIYHCRWQLNLLSAEYLECSLHVFRTRDNFNDKRIVAICMRETEEIRALAYDTKSILLHLSGESGFSWVDTTLEWSDSRVFIWTDGFLIDVKCNRLKGENYNEIFLTRLEKKNILSLDCNKKRIEIWFRLHAVTNKRKKKFFLFFFFRHLRYS